MKFWLLILSSLILISCQSSKTNKIPNPYEPGSPKKQKEALGFVPRGLDLNKAPSTIAFGSCSDQDQPMPIWKHILSDKPDLMITMGDNIYASTPEKKPILDQYKKINKVEDYKKARETIPFLAMMDDHDYGQNDGGADNPEKEEARKAFWFEFPYIKDSTLLDQPGVFHSKVMGGVKEGRGRRARVSQSLHVIMLDTRWNRSPLTRVENPDGTKKYLLNEDPKATILGKDQWEWLEDQLQEPADFKILVSSIQVIANDHVYEKWGNFPLEQKRLYDLIARVKPKNLVILSGDRHLASIAKTEIKGWGTLYDVTSSSFNRSKNAQENDATYVQPAFGGENYGLMKLDWQKRTASIEIKDIEGKVVQSLDLKMKR